MTDDVLDERAEEMEKTVAAFKKELSHVRTGRASTALLEGIHVEYYGAKTPLNQLATLSAPEARLLVVQPFDKTALTAIEKAIQHSDLGLNPQNDGKIIRIPIPPLTEERRQDLVKHVHKVAEDYPGVVRSHRRDALEMLKELEKDKEHHRGRPAARAEKIEALTQGVHRAARQDPEDQGRRDHGGLMVEIDSDPAAAPRRDHHGRQRPLGAAAWAATRCTAIAAARTRSARSSRRRGASAFEYLSLYAFSTENWQRPPREVDGLMRSCAAT